MTLQENYKTGTDELLFVKHIPDGLVKVVREEVDTFQQQLAREPYMNWGTNMLPDDYCQDCEEGQCKSWLKVKTMYDKVMKPFEPLFSYK